jgi:O-antigen ligase
MTTATFALPARTLDERAGAFAGRGWRAYLVAAALLLPFALPSGPAQLAALDLVNLGALAVFAAVVMLRRVPVVVPFAVPLIVIGAASLLAVTNARSVGASALSLAQDAYLVAWFVLLVAVMSRQGNLRPVALAWVVVSDLAALVCIAQAAQAGAFPGQLLSAEGFRPAGTFYGANMAADYFVLSVFVALTVGRGGRSAAFALASIALLVVALLVTKSNGSLIALVIGLAAAGIVWAMRGEGARLRRLGGLALLAAVVVLGSFAAIEWGALGDARRIGEAGMLGRMEKSSTSRQAIWSQLAGRLVRNPLGIGPGNSVHQSVAIGYRVRPSASFQSKEAHSDYIAYAVERGPLGLVGHLLWVAAGLALVLGGRGPAPRLEWLRAAFAGGLVATAVHSAVIEKLHFRHYWLFLALACATMAASRFRPEHPAEARP